MCTGIDAEGSGECDTISLCGVKGEWSLPQESSKSQQLLSCSVQVVHGNRGWEVACLEPVLCSSDTQIISSCLYAVKAGQWYTECFYTMQ